MQLIECMLLSDYYTGSFQETVPRKTARNAVKHGGVGLVVANHRSGCGNLVTVTRLFVVKFVLLDQHVWSLGLSNSNL